MINQLSNKYLLNAFMVYLDHYDKGWTLQVERIDQLSNKYLLNNSWLRLMTYFQGAGLLVEKISQLLTKLLERAVSTIPNLSPFL